MENKKRFRTRSAILHVLDLFFKKLQPEYLEKNIEVFARPFFVMLDDKERIVQAALWSGSIITLLERLPREAVHRCDPHMIESKTLDNLKKCASGIG